MDSNLLLFLKLVLLYVILTVLHSTSMSALIINTVLYCVQLYSYSTIVLV